MTTEDAKMRRVLRLLVPCSRNHRDDEDWLSNMRKQVCQRDSCRRALCEYCAGKVEERPTPPNYMQYCRLWCTEHAS